MMPLPKSYSGFSLCQQIMFALRTYFSLSFEICPYGQWAFTSLSASSIISGILIFVGHMDMHGISVHALHMEALCSMPMFNLRRAQ